MISKEAQDLLDITIQLHEQEEKMRKIEDEILASDDELLKSYVRQKRLVAELKKKIFEE